MKKTYIVLLFICILMFTACSKAIDERSLYVCDSDVIIKATDEENNYTMHGNIIYMDDNYADIVTARHGVLTDCNPKVYIAGYEAAGEVIYYSVNHDFAIVRVDVDGNEKMFEYAYPAIMSDTELEKDDEIWFARTSNPASSAAYQQDIVAKVTDPLIYFDEIYEDTIMFEADVYEGESGSGIYNMNDELVGIIIASDEDYCLAIPIDVIKEEY